MNLNCLACQGIVRTNSDKELENLGLNFGKIESKGSWSDSLGPPRPNFEKMRCGSSLATTKKVKKAAPRRMHSGPIRSSVEFNDDDDQPRLVRSSGMRRDWSFEDLFCDHLLFILRWLLFLSAGFLISK